MLLLAALSCGEDDQTKSQDLDAGNSDAGAMRDAGTANASKQDESMHALNVSAAHGGALHWRSASIPTIEIARHEFPPTQNIQIDRLVLTLAESDDFFGAARNRSQSRSLLLDTRL